jgi:hypothetical protein
VELSHAERIRSRSNGPEAAVLAGRLDHSIGNRFERELILIAVYLQRQELLHADFDILTREGVVLILIC